MMSGDASEQQTGKGAASSTDVSKQATVAQGSTCRGSSSSTSNGAAAPALTGGPGKNGTATSSSSSSSKAATGAAATSPSSGSSVVSSSSAPGLHQGGKASAGKEGSMSSTNGQLAAPAPPSQPGAASTTSSVSKSSDGAPAFSWADRLKKSVAAVPGGPHTADGGVGPSALLAGLKIPSKTMAHGLPPSPSGSSGSDDANKEKRSKGSPITTSAVSPNPKGPGMNIVSSGQKGAASALAESDRTTETAQAAKEPMQQNVPSSAPSSGGSGTSIPVAALGSTTSARSNLNNTEQSRPKVKLSSPETRLKARELLAAASASSSGTEDDVGVDEKPASVSTGGPSGKQKEAASPPRWCDIVASSSASATPSVASVSKGSCPAGIASTSAAVAPPLPAVPSSLPLTSQTQHRDTNGIASQSSTQLSGAGGATASNWSNKEAPGAPSAKATSASKAVLETVPVTAKQTPPVSAKPEGEGTSNVDTGEASASAPASSANKGDRKNSSTSPTRKKKKGRGSIDKTDSTTTSGENKEASSGPPMNKGTTAQRKASGSSGTAGTTTLQDLEVVNVGSIEANKKSVGKTSAAPSIPLPNSSKASTLSGGEKTPAQEMKEKVQELLLADKNLSKTAGGGVAGAGAAGASTSSATPSSLAGGKNNKNDNYNRPHASSADKKVSELITLTHQQAQLLAGQQFYQNQHLAYEMQRQQNNKDNFHPGPRNMGTGGANNFHNTAVAPQHDHTTASSTAAYSWEQQQQMQQQKGVGPVNSNVASFQALQQQAQELINIGNAVGSLSGSGTPSPDFLQGATYGADAHHGTAAAYQRTPRAQYQGETHTKGGGKHNYQEHVQFQQQAQTSNKGMHKSAASSTSGNKEFSKQGNAKGAADKNHSGAGGGALSTYGNNASSDGASYNKGKWGDGGGSWYSNNQYNNPHYSEQQQYSQYSQHNYNQQSNYNLQQKGGGKDHQQHIQQKGHVVNNKDQSGGAGGHHNKEQQHSAGKDYQYNSYSRGVKGGKTGSETIISQGEYHPPPTKQVWNTWGGTKGATSSKGGQTGEYNQTHGGSHVSAKRGVNPDGTTHTRINLKDGDSGRVGVLDDDIVEALHKPEMRSFLLRFERNMLLALVNPNVERVKFTTPFKSYQRRLVHRLADYYGYEREVTGRSAEEKSITPSGVEQKAYLTLLKTKQTQMSKPNLLEICQSQKLELPEKFANGYQFSTTLQLPKKDIKAGGKDNKPRSGAELTSILEEGNESEEEEFIRQEQHFSSPVRGAPGGGPDASNQENNSDEATPAEQEPSSKEAAPTASSSCAGSATASAASSTPGTATQSKATLEQNPAGPAATSRSPKRSSGRRTLTGEASNSASSSKNSTTAALAAATPDLQHNSSTAATGGAVTTDDEQPGPFDRTASDASLSSSRTGTEKKIQRPMIVRRRTEDQSDTNKSSKGAANKDKEAKDITELTYEERERLYQEARAAVLGEDFDKEQQKAQEQEQLQQSAAGSAAKSGAGAQLSSAAPPAGAITSDTSTKTTPTLAPVPPQPKMSGGAPHQKGAKTKIGWNGRAVAASSTSDGTGGKMAAANQDSSKMAPNNSQATNNNFSLQSSPHDTHAQHQYKSSNPQNKNLDRSDPEFQTDRSTPNRRSFNMHQHLPPGNMHPPEGGSGPPISAGGPSTIPVAAAGGLNNMNGAQAQHLHHPHMISTTAAQAAMYNKTFPAAAGTHQMAASNLTTPIHPAANNTTAPPAQFGVVNPPPAPAAYSSFFPQVNPNSIMVNPLALRMIGAPGSSGVVTATGQHHVGGAHPLAVANMVQHPGGAGNTMNNVIMMNAQQQQLQLHHMGTPGGVSAGHPHLPPPQHHQGHLPLLFSADNFNQHLQSWQHNLQQLNPCSGAQEPGSDYTAQNTQPPSPENRRAPG